jgi:hypothetical protein
VKLLNILVWLFAGAVVGWFASRMGKVEIRKTPKPIPVKDSDSKKS